MVIATRELIAICKSGERKPVILRLEAPMQDDGFWRCWYEIDWPEDEEPARTRRFYAGGKDALQAVQLGLMMLGIEVHSSRYTTGTGSCGTAKAGTA
jgi:hypothetical protein